jgi:hypothetical protein
MKSWMLWGVAAHLVVAGWHGFTHQVVPVPLTSTQTAFVLVVIMASPLIGAGLSIWRNARVGALIILASMTASLFFGLTYHFVVVSPDNIWCVPPGPWRPWFISSAILVAVSEAAVALLAALHFRQLTGGSS